MLAYDVRTQKSNVPTMLHVCSNAAEEVALCMSEKSLRHGAGE